MMDSREINRLVEQTRQKMQGRRWRVVLKEYRGEDAPQPLAENASDEGKLAALRWRAQAENRISPGPALPEAQHLKMEALIEEVADLPHRQGPQ